MLAGKPLLQWVVDNLTGADEMAPVMVATSTHATDGPIAAWCAGQGVRCHRGPLDDVASRVMAAARSVNAEAFVRVSGDSPLIDPALVSQALKLFRAADVDLATNIQVRTFPKGFSVEVIRVAALDRHLQQFETGDDREHVTTVLYRHPDNLRMIGFTSGAALGELQLSVDTEDDFFRAERILQQLGGGKHPGWRVIAELATSALATTVPHALEPQVDPC
jgi:spore coat polysaccharide biosynthesis protein SpsF